MPAQFVNVLYSINVSWEGYHRYENCERLLRSELVKFKYAVLSNQKALNPFLMTQKSRSKNPAETGWFVLKKLELPLPSKTILSVALPTAWITPFI